MISTEIMSDSLKCHDPITCIHGVRRAGPGESLTPSGYSASGRPAPRPAQPPRHCHPPSLPPFPAFAMQSVLGSQRNGQVNHRMTLGQIFGDSEPMKGGGPVSRTEQAMLRADMFGKYCVLLTQRLTGGVSVVAQW